MPNPAPERYVAAAASCREARRRGAPPDALPRRTLSAHSCIRHLSKPQHMRGGTLRVAVGMAFTKARPARLSLPGNSPVGPGTGETRPRPAGGSPSRAQRAARRPPAQTAGGACGQFTLRAGPACAHRRGGAAGSLPQAQPPHSAEASAGAAPAGIREGTSPGALGSTGQELARSLSQCKCV